LPVIRYRTRDLTRLLPPTSRAMRRMAKIVGRSDDMLIIRGVNVFPTQIEELILKTPVLAPHYLLEVTRDGHLDAMTVHVESAPGIGTSQQFDGIATELAQQVKTFVGINVRVQVGPPGAIERSLGKAKHVIDRRAG
jgi:phenylacetate-CoA ligase